MNKIPCEVIKDLMPSYIDKLTSEVSNQMIEEHIADCASCKEALDAMKEGTAGKDPAEAETEQKEIDFLKKNRRRNKRILVCAIAAVVIILGVLFVTRYLVGQHFSDMAGDYFSWNVQTDGTHLVLDGTVVDDIFKISGFRYGLRDGVLYVETDTVPSGRIASLIYGKEFHSEYTAKEPFHQVNVNGRILWNNGDEISTIASCAYLSRHLYIGDMTANNQTARFLNIYNYLGPYMNELETASEPYGWKFHLLQDIPEARLVIHETDMESFAYVILAVIDNLDHVTFEYMTDGKPASKTITQADASEFFGQNIKDCYDDVSLLDELIHKTGIDHYTYGSVWSESSYIPDLSSGQADQLKAVVHLVNYSEEDLASFRVSFYVNGTLTENQGGMNADGSPIRKGESATVWMESGVLDAVPDNKADLYLDIQVETMDGTFHQIPEQLRIPTANGVHLHDIHITGNAEDGFTVMQ